MSHERWRDALGIFEETLKRPEEERSAFLEEACGEDTKMRSAVNELLLADQDSESFLDQPVGSLDETETLNGSPTARFMPRGTQVGRYRILRRIGRGGMSYVYLGERADDAFPRRVAIKLMRPGMESESMTHRLRVESRILAGLDHPYIARLYDGGTTENGLPYVVMEYIEGEQIDAYCKQQRLDLDERLILFRKICEAVHYAHQNLVVHRDIKPSNILTSPSGDPKLLDFGIAKLLNPELAGAGLEPTGTWHRVLTPSYASPEQIRGQAITTASDVYSLGVVLYQLLTGRLPYSFKGLTPSEIESLLADSEPCPPSLALERSGTGKRPSASAPEAGTAPSESPLPVEARRQLAGDLDAIVLKALRSEPQRRYTSVAHLSADIERFRDGLPVEARAGTWRYYSGKFIRRHRGALSAAVAAGLLLVALAATMTLQARRVAAERDKKAEVLELVLEMFRSSSPYAGRDLTVREALQRSVPVLEQGLLGQSEIRAEILHASGSILHEINVDDVARDQLEDALRIRRELFGDEHMDVVATLVQLAGAYRNLGDYDQAESTAREALTLARNLRPERHPDLCEPLVMLVSILCYQSQYDAAEEPAAEALALAHEISSDREQQISALQQMATIRSASGDHAEAARLTREALTMRTSRYGGNHAVLIGTWNNLGSYLRRSDDFDAAEQAFEEALRIHQEAFGDQRDASLLNNLAGVRLAKGDFASAEELYGRARALISELAGPNHRQLFFFDLRIARAQIHGGKAARAEGDLLRLLEHWRRELGEHWWIDDGVGILGESISAQGRCEEAEPLLVESFEKLLANIHHRVRRTALKRLREHLERCGREQEIAPFEARFQAS